MSTEPLEAAGPLPHHKAKQKCDSSQAHCWLQRTSAEWESGDLPPPHFVQLILRPDLLPSCKPPYDALCMLVRDVTRSFKGRRSNARSSSRGFTCHSCAHAQQIKFPQCNAVHHSRFNTTNAMQAVTPELLQKEHADTQQATGFRKRREGTE
jgi:hypothetical protein